MAEDRFERRRGSQKAHQARLDIGEWGNQCRNKRAYPSKHIARGALRVMVLLHPEAALSLTAYRCSTCKKWHLGNSRWHRRQEDEQQ